MKFKLTNGKEIILSVAQNKYTIKSEDECKSKFQYKLGQILLGLYPRFPILEEFFIPQERLSLDFFIPKLKVAFEGQGDQHYEFNPHFHKYHHNFVKSQERDGRKAEWCKLNDILLICIPYGKIEKEKIKKLIDEI